MYGPPLRTSTAIPFGVWSDRADGGLLPREEVRVAERDTADAILELILRLEQEASVARHTG